MKLIKKLLILVCISLSFSIVFTSYFNLDVFATVENSIDDFDYSSFFQTYDGWQFEKKSDLEGEGYYISITGYKDYSITDDVINDIDGYEFGSLVRMYYKLIYDDNSKTFYFEASTKDLNNLEYVQSLLGSAFYDDDMNFDILFYSYESDEYVLFSELIDYYNIDTNSLGIVIGAFLFKAFVVGLIALVAYEAIINNSTSAPNIDISINDVLIDTNRVNSIYQSVISTYYIFSILLEAKENVDIYARFGFDDINGILDGLNGLDFPSMDDLLNNDKIQEQLEKYGVSLSDIHNLLIAFLGINTLNELNNRTKKVLCLGRDFNKLDTSNYNIIDHYSEVAEEFSFACFYSSNFDAMLKQFGQRKISIVNELLLIFCIGNDWDFLLVTNPYHYMIENLQEHRFNNFSNAGNTNSTHPYGGYSYTMEISTLRYSGYDDLYSFNYSSTNTSTSIGYSHFNWSDITNPGNNKSGFYQKVNYYLTKELDDGKFRLYFG